MSTHLLFDVDAKVVARIYNNLDAARAKFVHRQEKAIAYGGWCDVEADEVDLGKGFLDDTTDGQKKGVTTAWEQWGALVERGRPESLRLFRLNPAATNTRAPGPGPICKRDWKPIAHKHLLGRRVILHADGARAYA